MNKARKGPAFLVIFFDAAIDCGVYLCGLSDGKAGARSHLQWCIRGNRECGRYVGR